jgi:hypothetical protein
VCDPVNRRRSTEVHQQRRVLEALGLNLKELSSGKRQGELTITKRGPSLARKLLYYWALRGVQQPALRGWYANFQKVGRGHRGTSEHRKMKGLIACGMFLSVFFV